MASTGTAMGTGMGTGSTGRLRQLAATHSLAHPLSRGAFRSSRLSLVQIYRAEYQYEYQYEEEVACSYEITETSALLFPFPINYTSFVLLFDLKPSLSFLALSSSGSTPTRRLLASSTT
ncbi:hypothetical protein FRC18_001650 [Serendipita sp. 400]|nr:hypothetical protein FRC18_001650 [Serendipita sp. 400]